MAVVRYTRDSMRAVVTIVLALSVVALPSAQRGARVSTSVECAATLGAGVKSRRTFCDVLIGARPTDSVYVPIPRHVGVATLLFDLHNRFTVPAVAVPGPLTFARHEAVVSVIKPTGETLSRAAVVREFRMLSDLFDQIAGGVRPGGVKSVGPGPAESIRVTVPAGISSVGIVGERLKVMTRASEETFETPGRPVAIVSNVRIEYRPAP